MDAKCKMSGDATTWPCAARGCPLFHDCYIEYEQRAMAMMPPPTNADRIRAMSDEELAVTLMCPNEMGLAEIPCDHDDGKNCCVCLLNWLKQPAGEG